MCGIVSIITKKHYGFIQKDIQIFEQLLYADALRGEDSTGVIGVHKDGDLYIDKSADDAHNFLIEYMGSKSQKEMLTNGVALIGHNRKATVGKIVDANAHPFAVNENFALVHNGSLYNHTKLKDTTVDSEALAHHIEQAIRNPNFSVDTFGEALAEVWGAYACVWYDQQSHKVQFTRNNERPLWLAEGPDAWYLASEGSMLHWILTRNSIQYKSLAQITYGVLYTLFPGTGREIVAEVIPEKKAQPVSSSTAGSAGTTTGNGADGKLGLDSEHPGEVSKSQCKRINKKYVGKLVDFWVDDYVEKHLFANPPSAEKDYLIIGESDQLQGHKHTIRGEVNLDKIGLLDINAIDNFFFTGVIQRIEYDKRLKQLVVFVHNIAKVPPVPAQQKAANEETSVTLH